MPLRPAEFDTPYEVTRPTPFQHISALAPDGKPTDDGVLGQGEVVWTHHLLPKVNGHRTALVFIDGEGEVLVEVGWLKLKDGAPDGSPHR